MHQILWSRRIKDPTTWREALWNAILDARGREETDKEIADRDLDGELIAQIEASEFYERLTWRPELMCALLEVVEQAEDLKSARHAAVQWGADNDVVVEAFNEPIKPSRPQS